MHPIFTHIPLGLAFISPFLALALWLMIRRSAIPEASWNIQILLQAIVLILAFAAMQTGSSDEKDAEKNVPRQMIEKHELAGKIFFFSSIPILIVSFFGRRGNNAVRMRLFSIVLCLVLSVLAVYTGYLGGEIVYFTPD